MSGHFERRRQKRESADAAAELIWKDESGQRRFECATIVDYSPGGAGVASPQPLAASSCLIVHAPGVGIVALSKVRSCAWRRTQYQLGIEFLEKAAISPQESAVEPDHHELLRAGVTGHAERVDQLYRALAFRYHPDNLDHGDSEVFLRIREAYRILSVSRPREPDLGIEKPLTGFGWQEEIRVLKDKKVAVLGILLQKRMGDYRNAVVSPTELESATGLAADEVGFILWYLREKGAVTMCDNSSEYAISAVGVDILESTATQCAPKTSAGAPIGTQSASN
jgi:hypothetical protein